MAGRAVTILWMRASYDGEGDGDGGSDGGAPGGMEMAGRELCDLRAATAAGPSAGPAAGGTNSRSEECGEGTGGEELGEACTSWPFVTFALC